VFSDAKLTDVDVAVGPEMKSTGEVLGVDKDLDTAIYKGFIAAGGKIPTEGAVFCSLREHDKSKEGAAIVKRYEDLGFKIYGSDGTSEFLNASGIDCEVMKYKDVKEKIGEEIQILINTPKAINKVQADTFPLRRAAIERNLPVLTCMDTAKIFAVAVEKKQKGQKIEYRAL